MANFEQWAGFKGRKWTHSVDVRDFIQELPRDSAGDDCIQCPRADGGTQGALPISKKKIHLPPQLFAFFSI